MPKKAFGSRAPSLPSGFAGPALSPSFGCSLTIRLQPVPTGSTKTRSVKANQDSALSTSAVGGASGMPCPSKPTRRGPSAPTWRYAEEAPGPPLNTKVTGRAGPASSTV